MGKIRNFAKDFRLVLMKVKFGRTNIKKNKKKKAIKSIWVWNDQTENISIK